jgi:hypothetical protein
MAVRISRKMPFGAGSRGFHFDNYADEVADLRRYQEGRTLEDARFRRGSLADRLFRRLSKSLVPLSKKKKS